jgi:hypothetical protein
MKNLILTVALVLLCSFSTAAQTEFEVPKNVKLEADSDFYTYKDDVINAANWLEETDLDKEVAKRKEVNAFIIKWASGVPDINIDLTEGISKLCGKNEDLMVLFFASYCRKNLENKNINTKTATKAAVISMIKVYKKGIGIIKNSDMDNAIQANEDNKLDEYITNNLLKN